MLQGKVVTTEIPRIRANLGPRIYFSAGLNKHCGSGKNLFERLEHVHTSNLDTVLNVTRLTELTDAFIVAQTFIAPRNSDFATRETIRGSFYEVRPYLIIRLLLI